MATASVTMPRTRETPLMLGGSLALVLLLGVLGSGRGPFPDSQSSIVPTKVLAAAPSDGVSAASKILTGSLPATIPARQDEAMPRVAEPTPVRRVLTTLVSAGPPATAPSEAAGLWLTLAVPHEVSTLDGATFVVDGATYRLAGVAPIPADQICGTRSGKPWSCGSRARVVLRQAVADQTLQCRPLGRSPSDVVAVSCLKAGQPLRLGPVQP